MPPLSAPALRYSRALLAGAPGPLLLPIFLFLFCRLLLAEKLSSAVSGPLDGSESIISYLTFTSTIGLVVSLVLNTISGENTRNWPSSPLLSPDDRASPHEALLDDKTPHSSSIRPNILSRIRRLLPGTALPLFLKCLFYLTISRVQAGVGARDLAVLSGLVPTSTALVEFIFVGGPFSSLMPTILIFAGVVLVQPQIPSAFIYPNALLAIISIILFSLYLIACQEYYHSSSESLHAQNIAMFLAELCLFAPLAFGLLDARADTFKGPFTTDGTYALLHGLVGLASSGILKHGNAIILSALTCISAIFPILQWVSDTPRIPGIEVLLGTTMLLYGAVALIAPAVSLGGISRKESHASPDAEAYTGDSPPRTRRHLLGQNHAAPKWIRITILILLLVSWSASPPLVPVRRPSRHQKLLTLPVFGHFALDAVLLPRAEVSRKCERRRLISHEYIERNPRPRDNETYAHFVDGVFDDVLLVVFFSHARYDVNLESYLEMYTPYYPNVIFVGPGNREDAGFNHSYDVVVDSYHSKEDLSDDMNYRMAGRMAHHMLYTVLHEHVSDSDCYEGYLWAPFDTFLNVPRLAQFDRDTLWYHSPFGVSVPNPALTNTTMHAPPANISPDPYGNVTEVWRHWGPDWWWGEPHFGLNVCMPAFEKVPAPMRQRLASLTGGETRLIGGSSDTVYIPHRLFSPFMDVLAIFLDTTCFLEIALPTAVHLILPENESISFVDHWWIWKPPFNATFVRQQWELGYEADTFHTFHWGDVVDGVFKPHAGIIDEARSVIRESFMRQQWPGLI